MFDKENWLILCINTIIIVIALIILFRYQDNKIKMYFKKIEKKYSYNQKYDEHIENDKNIISNEKLIMHKLIIHKLITYKLINKINKIIKK